MLAGEDPGNVADKLSHPKVKLFPAEFKTPAAVALLLSARFDTTGEVKIVGSKFKVKPIPVVVESLEA